jgi:hypothetical protein
MKLGIVADWYRKLGEGLGLLEVERSERSEEEIRRALIAVDEMAKFQVELRKKGVTPALMRRWINEDRRA